MRAPLPFTALVQFIGERFGRYESTPVPSFPTPTEIGSYGERVAAAFLRRQGYHVLYRNFLTPRGEIDLVCRCGDVLVFVEVRSRSSSDFGRPVETIGADKRDSLRYAAERYLGLLEDREIFHRFDAVEIMLVPGQVPVCTLHPNLFPLTAAGE
jgi:putative endonuclease